MCVCLSQCTEEHYCELGWILSCRRFSSVTKDPLYGVYESFFIIIKNVRGGGAASFPGLITSSNSIK